MSVYILTYKTGIKFPAHVVIMRKCDITDAEFFINSKVLAK